MSKTGYYVTKAAGVVYKMHRVVYELTHGYCPEFVDHKDTNRGNNHPLNLREATRPENQWNRKVNANNTTQTKGLCWNEANQNWQGCIHHNKKLYKKCSIDRSVVEAWLITKRQELHGEFSRNN